MSNNSPPSSRPEPTPDRLTLGSVDAIHVRVYGVVAAKPDYAYPLETAHYLKDKPFLTECSPYQESPIWDWAGELLAQA